MSLRWSSYTLPLSPPKEAQKRITAVFPLKLHFSWRKSAIKFLRVKIIVSDKVVRHSLANYLCKKYWWGTSPSTWNFGSNWPRWGEIADFRSIFALVETSIKSSIITNRRSPLLCVGERVWKRDVKVRNTAGPRLLVLDRNVRRGLGRSVNSELRVRRLDGS